MDQYAPFIAAGLFQCLIIDMTNVNTWLRLEFSVCNGHHKLILESWEGEIPA